MLKIDNKLPRCILEHRSLHKVSGTIIDGMLKRVEGGRLHTSFSQLSVRTGRLASSNPNLQNVQNADLSFRFDDGDTLELSVRSGAAVRRGRLLSARGRGC